ncbi:hypothetical protein FCL40_16355 [Ferrimonas sediminicola]|uniref:Uncharacterized protein n=1 Tax=Ferrimonas sediminicola TaxID=2569538 RepID=A0A4U1B9V8_9GAMM|nr:hypothetical protein [Ferrimonas sediminicola]TKB47274.1 hypothetical protein FCL40_16355 [Ferrimonas sediminicola]
MKKSCLQGQLFLFGPDEDPRFTSPLLPDPVAGKHMGISAVSASKFAEEALIFSDQIKVFVICWSKFKIIQRMKKYIDKVPGAALDLQKVIKSG